MPTDGRSERPSLSNKEKTMALTDYINSAIDTVYSVAYADEGEEDKEPEQEEQEEKEEGGEEEEEEEEEEDEPEDVSRLT